MRYVTDYVFQNRNEMNVQIELIIMNDDISLATLRYDQVLRGILMGQGDYNGFQST